MQSFINRLYATFVMKDRYLIFLDGLKVTLILTFAGFLLGTALGALLCAMMRSRNGFLRKAANAVTAFFMEMPTMVLLMILVYIVFGRSAVPIMCVISIGFMLKAASYLSRIFDTALSTVSEGEIEAARTLGMTKLQAFRYVTLPQTVMVALPLYRNQFIATLQETSVVGYLAVVDLTRASSVVSSRTLDAFMSIITVTIMYFLISAIVKLLFSLVSGRFLKGGQTA